MFKLWLSWRYLMRGKGVMSLVGSFAFFSLVIGVAFLVVAMAVVSGFESTLRSAVIDVTSDIVLIKRGGTSIDREELVRKIMTIEPDIHSVSRFLFLEGIVTFSGTLSGVIIQGNDPDSVDRVLHLNKRLLSGEYRLRKNPDETVAPALIGKSLAKKMNLKVGDVFNVILPIADESKASLLSKKVGQLKLVGVLNLGKYEYDERYVITDLAVTQELADIGNKYTGLLLKMHHSENAKRASHNLQKELGFPFWTRDWEQVNENLFRAVALEKVVIFFVILIIVIAAAFNISSTLFISVIQRYSDIGTLRAIGASRQLIMWTFSLQGLFIGTLGATLGLMLGAVLCRVLMWAQHVWQILPAEIYKLDQINVEIRLTDLVAIVVVTLIICFISTLAPAKRGANLPTIEGLRYE